MRKFKVVIEKTAESDLLEVLSYITNILKNPQAGRWIFDSVREQVMSLEALPFRYPVVDEEPYRTMGVRKIPVENYIVFYFVDEDAETVHVFRVLYSRREWQNLI